MCVCVVCVCVCVCVGGWVHACVLACVNTKRCFVMNDVLTYVHV